MSDNEVGFYLTQGFHRSLQQNPDAPMTRFGDRIRTFADVRDRVARLAGALGDLGVKRGDRIAILSLNSDDYSDQLLTALWMGAIVVPLNIRWSAPENIYALNDAGARVLFVDDTFAPLVPTLQSSVPGLAAIVHSGDGPLPAGCHALEAMVASGAPLDDVRAGDDELAGIFYTGGTTGLPKGVMLSHTNLVTSALGSLASGHFLTPGGRYLHAAPMFHLADFGAWTAQTLLGGAHVVVPRFDPTLVLEAIETHQVTSALLVPTMIQMVIEHPRVADFDTSSLQVLLYGASPIGAALLDAALKVFPQVAFTQAYGMTELSPVATLLSDHDHRPLSGQPDHTRSAGRAAPHSEVRVVDPDDNALPVGSVGEVTVRGAHVMQGYWNKPEETASALRNGWMHTGDAGYLSEDGYLYVVDRIKDMIITGGENVYSVEVENALTQHPAVAACAVIGIPDPSWGERVHAVIVLRPGAEASSDDLMAHTKSLIANYKAPRSFAFAEALPISAAGKVLKRELRDAAVQG
jgi:acyl-CoA synthetase (AMP-forming)/AMP-acid ligase II